MTVVATARQEVESKVVVRLIEECKQLWALYNQAVQDLEFYEKFESDLLHGLEFGVPLTKKGRPDKNQILKLGIALSDCMRKRREAKDTIETLESFAQWHGQHGQAAINSLGIVVGKMRQVEGKRETRHYQPRTHQGEAMLKDVAVAKRKPMIGGEKRETNESTTDWEGSVLQIAEAIRGNSETELLILSANENERKKRLLGKKLAKQPLVVGGE